MSSRLRVVLSFALLVSFAVPGAAFNAPAALAVSPDIVISQIYGGGGNSGATYTNDFIELFNRGSSAVSVTGWSVQYASSSGTTWASTAISGTLQPGQYYLVQQAQGTGGTTPLPTADAIGTIAGQASFEFLVVYDPAGGFVTGGGWIISPPGAYVPDPGATGKATFGFVAKYKKGANKPDGSTQFAFKAADLSFESNSYDWLVVNRAGTNAQFRGDGTVNGAAGYKFMIWAVDGHPDTFRIRIWQEVGATEIVLYDNGGTPLGGGSIVIHK